MITVSNNNTVGVI